MQRFAPRLSFLSSQKNWQKYIDMSLFAFHLHVYFSNAKLWPQSAIWKHKMQKGYLFPSRSSLDMGDTNFFYLLICPLGKKILKETNVPSFSLFWIQYKDVETSHNIASHQLALLKLPLMHWIQKERQVRCWLVLFMGPFLPFKVIREYFFQTDAESFNLPVCLP